jgi:PAS domain S-box-containing protein
MFCNQAAEKMFGYSKEELIGQPANLLVAESFKGQDKGSFDNALRRGTPTLTGKTIEVLGKRKNNQEFPVEVSVTTYMIDDKTYFTTTIHDITERNKMEEKIRRSEKMEAIGTLAGGVAHDLNNILSAMVGYPDLLLLTIPEDNPLRKPLVSIKSSGEKAAAIVNDLLTLARRGVNVTDVVNLNAVITDYLSSQQYEKLRSFHPRVEIDISLAPDILNIAGSPVHLSKIVMNLISNAAEAMPEGGKVIIFTRNLYLDKPVKGYDTIKEGDYVVLTVTDTGSGISPEDLSRIFEPFYTKKIMGRSGTGLGLAVVWGTVQDHNGYIEVDSTLGKGTSFSIYIPATRSTIAAKTEALPIERFLGRGEYILVVDDAEPQREIASTILEKLNYQVATVSSGEAAVEYLKSKPCDLLVLDMLMDPGIDGLETYKRILSIAPRQKAIIASGFSETEQVKETQRLGAGAYIKKPYTLEEIGMAVKTELAK